MKAYCVPYASLQSCQAVPKSSKYFEAIKDNPDKSAVEVALELARPTALPKRESAVYLFEDETQAKKWAAWKQRPLYLTEVSQKDIRLKADWCWLDNIMKAIKSGSSQVNEMTQNYWAGQSTAAPWWEFLATAAIVKNEIDIPILERNRFIEQKLNRSDF